MNRGLKTVILAMTAIMTLGAAGISFAAGGSASVPPASVKDKPAVTAHKIVKLKVSQKKAIQIASKAHKDAKLDSITLKGKAYIVKLSSDTAQYTIRVGANTGRIIKDVKTELKGKTPTAPAPAAQE